MCLGTIDAFEDAPDTPDEPRPRDSEYEINDEAIIEEDSSIC